MAFRKKIRKKNPDRLFKKLNYPVLILTAISLFLIGSLVYNIMGQNKNTDYLPREEIDLAKLLKKNSYEKNYNHRIQMHVYNGCGETGYAQTYKIFLREQGFDVMQIGNKQIYNLTTIYYHTNKKEMAEYLSEIIGGDEYKNSIEIIKSPNQNLGFDLTLVIGEDYQSLISYEETIVHLPKVLR